MAELIIYRGISTVVATVSIDLKTIVVKKLMNEDKIMSDFTSEAVIPVEIGDWIQVNSKKYYLNGLPGFEKVNDKTFKYATVTFQSELYDLYNKLLISSDGLNDFTIVGNATDLLTLIVSNMNEISSGWSLGVVDETQEKTMSFLNDTCRTALTKVAGEFGFEFDVNNKTIDFKKAIGNVTAHSFEYGKNKGLYSIERRGIDNKNVFTKIYAYGSTKNLSYEYRSRQKRLVFEERFLTKNTNIYGIKEGNYTNEDIFPHRTGTLTAVNIVFDAQNYDAANSYIEDNSLDFNINDYLIDGTAKIVFKSGDLSGSEFEIWKYDNETKRMYINPIGEVDGYSSPNENSKPKIGDTYTLVNIKMPPSYVIAAELELKEAAQVFLDENCTPKNIYLVKIDVKFAKTNAITLNAGDLVYINDADMGVNRAIRISEVSFPVLNPFEITAVIADFIPYTLEQYVSKTAIKSSKAIASIIKQITNIQNISNKTTNNTTIINEGTPESGFIFINGRKFKWIKGFDNFDPAILEPGDYIQDNYWNRILFVKSWKFLGAAKEFIENWEQIESKEIV